MILLALFIAIQLADIYLTWRGLKDGFDEANFLPAFLIERFGFWKAAIGVKAAGLVLCLLFMCIYSGWVFTAVLDALGIVVLVHNYRLLKGGNQ